jgi:hypothetical protein
MRIRDVSRRKLLRRRGPTRSRRKLSLLTKRMLRSIGPGRNLRRRKIARSFIRILRSRKRLARISLSRKRDLSRASWSSLEVKMTSI